MLRYVIKRIIAIFVTLFLVATITFIMMKAVPGSPFTGEKGISPQVLAQLNKKYKLDQPLMTQYLEYMKGLVTFNLGPSLKKDGVTVNSMIENSFPVSAKLGIITILFIVCLGIPLGILSALKRSKLPDYIITIFATLGISVPTFVLGALILYIFGAILGWIPTYGLTSWKSYIGPAISLGGFSLAFVMRLTRSSMLEIMGQDYIRTARAKGLSNAKIIGKHALKNALIPVVTYMGPMIAGILSGSFVTEKIFAIPGMGKFFVEAITNRDYTVIMGTTIFFAAFAASMILVVDIVYYFLDPRIRFE